MERTPATWIRITAAAVLVGGVAAAAGITHSPAPVLRIAGVYPQAVAELDMARVIKPADKMEFPSDAPTPAPTPQVHAALTSKNKAPAVTPARTATPAPALPAATSIPVPDDPGPKDIALVGITSSGGQDTAWLMNVDGRDREQAAVGENAFGYTVQTISDDSVVLSRSGKKYGLRVGEKPVLVASASTGDTLSGTDDAGGAPGGFGGPGGPGGQGGPGGRGAFGNRGGFGNNGGGSNRSFNGFGGGAPTSFGGSAASNTAGNTGGFGNRSGAGGGGGFGGGGFGGFGGGLGASSSGAPASQFSSSAKGATSNAQTARRRGVAVTGGETAMPTPTTIVNPQTQRRLGTSGTGSPPAFGTTSGTVSAFTSPNGTAQGGFSAAQARAGTAR